MYKILGKKSAAYETAEFTPSLPSPLRGGGLALWSKMLYSTE